MVALAFAFKYWREIVIGALVLAAIGATLYIRSVFKERNALIEDKARLTFQLKQAADMQEMANQITVAISQIKIRSQVNVSRIESELPPVFVDSGPLPFIPGGMLQAVYPSGTAARAAPGNAPGGTLPAGESPGAVLPR